MILACVVAIAAALASIAFADSIDDVTYYYAGLSPNQGAGSVYDTWCVNEYSQNSMYKSHTALGKVTFIDDGGNWNYTITNYNQPTVTIAPIGSGWFHKKAYCYDNSTVSYTAQCIVTRYHYSGCV
jgi:hypothetical protein